MRLCFRVYLLLLTIMVMLLVGCNGQLSATMNSLPSTPAPSSAPSGTPTVTIAATLTQPATPVNPTNSPAPNITQTSTSVGLTATPLSPPTALPAPAMPTAPLQSPAVRGITRADNGKTVYLRVGEEFLLQLGSSTDWKPTPSDLRVVRPVPGTPNLYQTFAPGTIRVSLGLEPPCRTAHPPCLMPTVLFQVTIVVR